MSSSPPAPSHIPVINIKALLETDPSQWSTSISGSTTAQTTPSSPTTCSPSAAAAVDAIVEACTGVGFFYVTGHGLDADRLIERMTAASHSFFDQPTQVKEEIAMKKGGKAWRGWFPVGDEFTSGVVDEKEGLYFGSEDGPADPRPLRGSNQWPVTTPLCTSFFFLCWLNSVQ